MSPILGTIAGFSAQGYGALKASAASAFTSFLATFGFVAGTGNRPARGATFDPSGNVIVVGQGLSSVTSGNTAGQLAKYSSDATLMYQKKFEGPISSSLPNGFYTVTTDSSGNIYAAGQFIPSTNDQVVLVVKHDSSGNVLWKKQFIDSRPATTKNSWARGIKVDLSGNVYVCGSNTVGTSQTNPFLIKLDPNGTLLWQRGLNGGFTGTRSDYFDKLDIDAAGNIYVAGRTSTAGGIGVATLAKYDPTGALVFSRQANVSGGFSGIKLDTAGNIYTSGSGSVTIGAFSGAAVTTTKFDSSGNLVWQRGLYSSTGTNGIRVEGGIDLDSGGNIYVAQTMSITDRFTTRRPQIIKYNPAGVLQWQKYIITDSNASNAVEAISVYKDRYILAGQYFSEWLGMQLPTDGSKDGTYTLNSINIAYTTSSFSEGLVSGVTFASGGTNTTPTFTTANATTTESVSTATSYIVTIPNVTPTVQITGGELYSDATYYYRVFKSNGTLSVSGGTVSMDSLIISGGGGGGPGAYTATPQYVAGGGGGAGGVVVSNSTYGAGNIAVTIGAGGADTNGSQSTITGVTSSIGGGLGNAGGTGSNVPTGSAGGSGGGGTANFYSGFYFGSYAGGAGTAGQGNAGGASYYFSQTNLRGGGGGGAGAVGQNGQGTGLTSGGNGGTGTAAYSSWGAATFTGELSGTTRYYAGGGGGGAGSSYLQGIGGLGGGGSGTVNGVSTPGLSNTGGGGGGGGSWGPTDSFIPGAKGGSGIVIFRYTRASVGG